MFSKIPFEKIENFRDLGGLETADGRTVKTGLLYRSSSLSNASEKDIEKLAELGISQVIDLRSPTEQQNCPNPKIGNAENIPLPIINDAKVGITMDNGMKEMMKQNLLAVFPDVEAAKKFMYKTYFETVIDEFAVEQFSRFAKLLLESDGASVWHCTAGKDRTGTGAVIVYELLGVPKDVIIEDYLYTNACLAEDIEKGAAAAEQTGGKTAGDVLRSLFSVNRGNIEAIYSAIEQKFGGFDNYIRTGLGLDEQFIADFKEKYTE